MLAQTPAVGNGFAAKMCENVRQSRAGRSVPHGPDLGLELRIGLELEVPSALAALPGPRFILLLGQDDDTADLFARDPVQGDREQLAFILHGGVLVS